MAYLLFKTKPFNSSIINFYVPTKNSSDDDKGSLNHKLEEVLELPLKEETITILGNFNAQIGKEQ